MLPKRTIWYNYSIAMICENRCEQMENQLPLCFCRRVRFPVYGLYGIDLPWYTIPMDMIYIILIAILMVFSSLASSTVARKFNKYATVRISCNKSARQVAQELLSRAGSNVEIRQISGSLTDNYNPSKGVVSLSQATYASTSVSAVAVAAHEIGHVMQYQEGYGPIRFRNALLPTANIGSTFAPYLVVFGLLLRSSSLAVIGVVLYFTMFLFQAITLPVELDASRRALSMLQEGGYITMDETDKAKEVLKAAAMTYFFAALGSLVSFLRLFSMAMRTRRRN